MTTNETTRRTLVAGLAVAPLAGVPAIAGAVSAAPMSEPLAKAIERHKVAQAAMEAAYGPEDLSRHLCDAETAALDELAETPCLSDAEFMEKLRYLLRHETAVWGEPNMRHDFGSVLVALDTHFNSEA